MSTGAARAPAAGAPRATERSIAGEAEMRALGAALARSAPAAAVVALEGELGSGKTTLVRGLLRALGHAGHVRSPSYTLVEPYEVAGACIYHFDLYRLGSPEELDYLGAREHLDGGGLCLIEWPERGRGFLPVPDLSVRIAYRRTGRGVRISAHTSLGRSWLDRWEADADSSRL